MQEVLKSNYLECVKGAQRSIYVSYLISALLYILALTKSKAFPDTTLLNPLSYLEANGHSGLIILLLFYFFVGSLLCFQLRRSNYNFQEIEDREVKYGLSIFPSIACGKYTRIFSCLSPIIIFSIAVFDIFKGNFLGTFLIVVILSIPYLFASTISQEKRT